MNSPTNRNIAIGFVLLFLFSTGCALDQDVSPEPVSGEDIPANSVSMASVSDPFGDYWYQGEAELTSYDLEQVRYGSIHDGEAVLIFVTEDFSKKKQVKLDNPASAGDDKVGVLKLNFSKNFNTGVYPYSMMSSVFTPIHRTSYPRSLKVTTTSQEWCGHTFTQFNLDDEKYDVHVYSYFESEGDERLELDAALLEDEIWTIIRLEPESLPTGSIQVIPGSMYQRLSHTDFEVTRASATLEPVEGREELMEYALVYDDARRTLRIQFNKVFPHEIEGWEEVRTSGQGAGARDMVTRATRKERIMLDYWTRNQPEDEALRQELGLE